MCSQGLVFFGTIATAKSMTHLSVHSGYLVVENGKITKTGTEEEFKDLYASGAFKGSQVILLNDGQFLMPGFVDCHTHAPQFPNIGLGLDRPVMEWLVTYTFPLESQFRDVEFAREVYDTVVRRLLDEGTTTACYFGSLHFDSTLELVRTVMRHYQRALVGKVSMNLHNEDGYYNETSRELTEAKRFVEMVLAYKDDLVQPIITPRGATSCDEELLIGLSDIREQYNCRIQSHISETQNGNHYALELNPGSKNFAEIYEKSRVLNDKCIMAHAVHLTDDEIKILVERGVSIAHCPSSNTRLLSGLCPVRKLLNNGLVVGLGTDVSAGDSTSILDAIRRTMDVSAHLQMKGDEDYSISWTEAFYLATLGGAKALHLEDKIGSLEVGKEFDALLIDVYTEGGPIDRYGYLPTTTQEEYACNLLQKFLHLGDDRNIVQVYVKGMKVKDKY